jgi:methyl-accepting chemotaxis protein
MLRRRLLFNLGPLVLLLLCVAVGSIVMLQRTLSRLDHLDATVWQGGGASAVAAAVAPAGDADHVRHERAALIASFRWTVIGLTAAFVIVINVAVVLLLHVARIVVRPVDQLVTATRAVAEGRFDVRLAGSRLEADEFTELARAFDAMAEKLQSAEQVRMETLGQVAVTMSHEINNAIAIIELQVDLLARQAPSAAGLQARLNQIRNGLDKMTQSVRALSSARRFALTDYLPGMKMLDLQRSQDPDGLPRPPLQAAGT